MLRDCSVYQTHCKPDDESGPGGDAGGDPGGGPLAGGAPPGRARGGLSLGTLASPFPLFWGYVISEYPKAPHSSVV